MTKDVFNLFGLEPSFLINKSNLKKKYYQLSKAFHPDFFHQSNYDKKDEAELTLSDIHNAMKILSNLDLTIKYVLEKKGILSEQSNSLPQHFLFETMELNESLQERKMNNDTQGLKEMKKKINQKKEELFQAINPLLLNYTETVGDKKSLSLLKDYYLKKKYFDRLSEQLKEV